MTDELEREAEEWSKSIIAKTPDTYHWDEFWMPIDLGPNEAYRAGALAERKRILSWIFDKGHYADGDVVVNWEELKMQFPIEGG